MASPAAILRILVEANTAAARADLQKFDKSLATSTAAHTKTTDTVEKNNKRMHGSFSSLAKGVVAAGGAFVAFEAAKSAITDTMELAKATHQLSVMTGMNTKLTSQWIEAAKVRHVTTTALSMSFVTLSKNIRNAEDAQTKTSAAVQAAIKTNKEQVATLEATGAAHGKVVALEKKQADALVVLKAKSSTVTAAFKELGVSQDIINKGDPTAVIKAVADGLAKVENPARRAALAQQLFGRAGRSLLPMLADGAKGIDTALAATQRYGAYLPKNAAQLEKARVAQQNLNLAMDGLKISFTEAVLPALVTGAQKLMEFISQMRNGKGAGGEFASAIRTAFNTVKTIVTNVVSTFGGLGNTIKIALAAFAVSKVVKFAGALKDLFLLMRANPIGAFLTVVGLLGAAFASLSTNQEGAAMSAKDVANAWRKAKDAAKGLQDANFAVTQAHIQLKNAQLAVTDATKAQSQALQQAGKHSQQYAQATNTLHQANLDLKEAEVGVTRATDDAKTAQDKKRHADDQASTALGTSKKAYDALTNSQSKKIQADQQEAIQLGNQIDKMKSAGASTDAIRGKQAALRDVVQRLADEQQGLNNTLKKQPAWVKSTVAVNIDFLSNVQGAVQSIAGQIKGFATGGMVNKPGYFAGEEAPRHPEVILATNPAYRSRNLQLWQQAGGMLGVPGFATGGVSYARAGSEIRGIDPWAIKKADAWIAPIAKVWGVAHSVAGRMIAAAQSITGLPYTWGGGHGGFFGTPGFDCSGAVSYVLHAGGMLSSPVTTDGLKGWGDPGPGKQITVGVRGTTGRNAHTMMSMFGRFFESGGSGGGPHWDAGWDGGFPILRHPRGFASGGVYGKGEFGDVPPKMLLAMNPTLAMNPSFWQYAKNAPSFAKGGWFDAINHQYPRHGTGTAGATFSPNLVAKLAEWAGMPGVTMAQIAHGESSYMPGIVQSGQDAAHTGWGLWQITPGNSSLLNPVLNAKAAAAKYRAAKATGNALSPWFGTKYLTDPNAHFTGTLGVSKGHTSTSSPPPPTVAPPLRPNPAVVALRGPLGKTARWLAGMSGIPSQSTGQQIQAGILSNALTTATNTGNVPGQLKALGGEQTLEKAWLAADRVKLRKINKALRRKDLSHKGRATLLTDKLALLQEIGTVEGAIGSIGQSITDLTTPSTTDAGAGGDPNQPLIDALNAQATAATDLTNALNTQTQYMASVGEIEKRQAIKAFADVISGQIGGQYLSRSTGSAGDGSIARYGSVARA